MLYTITYFYDADVHTASQYDIPHQFDVEADNYESGIVKFNHMGLGHLWSIDLKEPENKC